MTGIPYGELLVTGLEGKALSSSEKRALERGERSGVVVFRRSIEPGVEGMIALSELLGEVHDRLPRPIVAIDQEGGRVARLGPPALSLPPMSVIGSLGDVALAEALAEAQGRELAALGFTMNFAPVADVRSRENNPIIGDRSFSPSPHVVAEFSGAWARGLVRGGVHACLKHFPGHGDTELDSHLALPTVTRKRDELEDCELVPFRALARDPNVAAMMTAHVVYPALDDEDARRPATLSKRLMTDLLRRDLGFPGVLFSDDLEMHAIDIPVGDAAVAAIEAGCDLLLVCSRPDYAEQAFESLLREGARSPAFRARCEESLARVRALRATMSRPKNGAALGAVFERSKEIAERLALRLDASQGSHR